MTSPRPTVGQPGVDVLRRRPGQRRHPGLGADRGPDPGTTALASSGAGSYPITLTGGTSANYTLTRVNGTLTIDKALLTLTADDKSKTYGQANPALTFSVDGLVNGDTRATALTADPSLDTALASSGAGSYPITLTGGTSANYTLTRVNGTLTIDKRGSDGHCGQPVEDLRQRAGAGDRGVLDQRWWAGQRQHRDRGDADQCGGGSDRARAGWWLPDRGLCGDRYRTVELRHPLRRRHADGQQAEPHSDRHEPDQDAGRHCHLHWE